MTELAWSTNKPTQPGWYWMLCAGDKPGRAAEIICRVNYYPTGLVASWMTAPGEAGLLHSSKWDPEVLWAGPIEAPDR